MLFYFFKSFFVRETGATAIEYSLIACAIALAIAVVVFAFGEDLVLLFEDIAEILASAEPR